MNIVIIGVGYVGLVTAACFAEMGHHVTCLDIDKEKIDRLNQGVIPIYEPGLEEMVKRNLQTDRLHFTEDYSKITGNTVYFIAVDTPMSDNGSADIGRVEQVAWSLGEQISAPCTIVIKSTVPVGTSLKVESILFEALKKRNLSIPFYVVSNPEFLKEGDAIQDFMKPDRVIIGANTPEPIEFMKALYAPFMLNHDRLLVMNRPSAELAKYAANAALAVRVSFMNEIANLCEKMGADIDSIRHALGSDHRIGNKFLYAGVGFGGSCFPKDINALIYQGALNDSKLLIVDAASTANQHQKQIMGKKIKVYFSTKGGLKGKSIGILGLSFKPNTDDMREAPSLTLINDLISQGATLKLYDPIATENAKRLIKDDSMITWCPNEFETAKGVDALVLMTEWKQFRTLNLSTILSTMKGSVFFDGRNQFHPEEMARKGFDYISIGRPPLYKKG